MLKTRTFLMLLAIFVSVDEIFAQREKKKITDQPPSDERRLSQAEALFVEGQKYYLLEDYSKALAFFQKAAQFNPLDAGAHYKVAEVLNKSASAQDLALASTSIEAALRIDKKNEYYYTLAAEIYAARQDFIKAAAAIENMLREIPGQETSLFQLAAYYAYAGKKDEAFKTYGRAENLFGVNETSSLQKQQLLLEQGKVNDAITEAERLIKAFPDEPQYVMAFAEMLNQNGQRARALQTLEKFLAENPSNGNAKMLLSVLYKENNQADKANQLLTSVFDDAGVETSGKILVISTLNTEIAQARAKNSPDVGLEKLAVTLFEKLQAADPAHDMVSLIGGDLFLTLGQPQTAKKLYRKAIKQGASGFEPWQNLLLLENQDNAYDSLIAHTEEGLELFPNQAILYYFNGYGHLRKKHYKEACFSLEQAKKLSPGNDKLLGDVNGMLGDAYNATKQYALSDASYDEALALNPNNDVVLNNYSYYLSLRKENLEKAEAMAAKLVKLIPDNATYLDTYGWVLFVSGKYKEARKVLEKATAMPLATATHVEHLGDVLFQLGEVEEAVRQWEKAKAMGSNTDGLIKKIANQKLN
jgi:tetratricopeptide (TPR) repeat protein